MNYWKRSVKSDEYDCLCGQVITAKSCRYYSILDDPIHIKAFCKCGTVIISVREIEQIPHEIKQISHEIEQISHEIEQIPHEIKQIPHDSSLVGKIIIIAISITMGYLIVRQTQEK